MAPGFTAPAPVPAMGLTSLLGSLTIEDERGVVRRAAEADAISGSLEPITPVLAINTNDASADVPTVPGNLRSIDVPPPEGR